MAKKMSDGIIRPRTVLNCVLQLQRQGVTPAMQQLEETEPDLAEYLLGTLSNIHHELLGLHGRLPGPAACTDRCLSWLWSASSHCGRATLNSGSSRWMARPAGMIRIGQNQI